MKFRFHYEPVRNWSVRLPQSKSYIQRALIISSLAEGKSRIIMRDLSDDVRVMLRALSKFGIKIRGNTVHGSMPVNSGNIISCGESGASIRFLTSYSTLVDRGYTVLTGKPGLLRRPIKPLVDAIVNLGGWAATINSGPYPPVIVKAKKMSGGEVTIEASDSSQYVSSLLMVLPYSNRQTEVRAVELVSRPYVDMTIYVMKKFGINVEAIGDKFIVQGGSYKASEFEPPADASSAEFFMALSLLSGRKIMLGGLSTSAPQADLNAMLETLKKLDVPYKIVEDGLIIEESNIRNSLEIDLKNSPDSITPISVLGLKIRVKINGVEHARIKESDRITAISSELSKLGAEVEQAPDGLLINPPEAPRKGIMLNGWNDHRVVMALAVADAALELKSTIENYESVKKSYPRFFDDMAALGYKVIMVE